MNSGQYKDGDWGNEPQDNEELKENFLSALRLLEEQKTSPEWVARKYLTLFKSHYEPQIEELDKIRSQIAELIKKLDDREADLINAKKQRDVEWASWLPGDSIARLTSFYNRKLALSRGKE